MVGNLFDSLFERKIRINRNFEEVKRKILESKNSSFERTHSTKEFFRFDYMNDGFYAKKNLHRIKLFNISAHKKDEIENSALVYFRLTTGIYIFHLVLIVGIFSMSLLSGIDKTRLAIFAVIVTIGFIFTFVLFKTKFENQFHKLKIDLFSLFDNAKILEEKNNQ
jgi:hypothetical protein